MSLEIKYINVSKSIHVKKKSENKVKVTPYYPYQTLCKS